MNSNVASLQDATPRKTTKAHLPIRHNVGLNIHCGCGWSSSNLNAHDALDAGLRHSEQTGHAVDINGIIRTR